MSTVAPAVTPSLVMPGKSLSAGAGLSWIAEGWALFRKAWLMWIVLTVLTLIAALVFAFIPFLGSLAWQLLTPVIVGGLMLACRALERGEELEMEYLFAGFRSHFTGLAAIGLLYLLGGIVVLLVFAMFAGMSMLPILLSGNADSAAGAIAALGSGFLAGTLVVTALSVLLAAAVWLAPALVVMHGMPAIEAMKASFFAVMRNFLGALLFAVVMFVLAIVAAIPFGLGMLVWMPLVVTATYRTYRQVFTE